MKILFNGKDCGLGNNGGSHTLVQSASVLAKLGVEVVLFGPYKYTWYERPKNVTIIESGKIPTCDVIIATGQSTVPSTIDFKGCKKKFWWVRGHEVWSTSESQLTQYYRNIKCIVNGTWLRDYIKAKTGGDSPVIHQGVDFDLWGNEKPWKEREIQIGGLYSERHKTKNHWILEELEKQGFSVKMLNRDIKKPTFEQQKDWYNNIKVWVSTSTLEGFHNPPVEAAMCGCALISNDHWKGGTNDYTNHNYNNLEYKSIDNEVYQIKEHVNHYLNEEGLAVRLNKRLQEDIRKKIGSREENMKKMLEIFSI